MTNLLDPSGAPRWRIKWVAEILDFVATFSFFKFHDADCVHRLSFVVDQIFRDPEISGATDAAYGESSGTAWMMSPQTL